MKLAGMCWLCGGGAAGRGRDSMPGPQHLCSTPRVTSPPLTWRNLLSVWQLSPQLPASRATHCLGPPQCGKGQKTVINRYHRPMWISTAGFGWTWTGATDQIRSVAGHTGQGGAVEIGVGVPGGMTFWLEKTVQTPYEIIRRGPGWSSATTPADNNRQPGRSHQSDADWGRLACTTRRTPVS